MTPHTPQITGPGEIVGGVDTHRDTHTAAALDVTGRVVATEQFPASTTGYVALLVWLRTFGSLLLVGIEGTGAYGAGLTRYLHSQGVVLIEVDRPDRKTRRRQGKSDPIDAVAAARAVLAQHRTGIPKQWDGEVEALRNLRVARRSAINQRADTQRQIKALIITAPEPLRDQLRGLSVRQLIATCVSLSYDRLHTGDPATAATIALQTLARRHQRLTAEISELDELIAPLIEQINPALLQLTGVGHDVAGQLLVTAGENVERLNSEAAFAMLCGVAPLPASSGRTNRHRLNRGGDRQANCALHRIVLCRMRWDTRTRDYVARRTEDGLSKRDIIRCLKRYIAREVYRVLMPPATSDDHQTVP